jgi:3',5'-nucleoside bisphosphate phosphatase
VRIFAADLHVHTALSPCCEDAMTPPLIVDRARAAGLDIIAICDHNSTGNTAAVEEAAAGKDLHVIPGIEITTEEEVHVTGLFPDAGRAARAGEAVLAGLPRLRAGRRRMGNQLIMDAAGNVLGGEERMLSMASTLTLRAAVALIHHHGGLAIAAHADRPANSVISQLGFFPDDLSFDAIEISEAGMAAGRFEAFMDNGMPMITASDAHFPEGIGSIYSLFEMAAASLDELRLALTHTDGRRCGFA